VNDDRLVIDLLSDRIVRRSNELLAGSCSMKAIAPFMPLIMGRYHQVLFTFSCFLQILARPHVLWQSFRVVMNGPKVPGIRFRLVIRTRLRENLGESLPFEVEALCGVLS
jgi:hypothetical protein